jgi:hypothetical protein
MHRILWALALGLGLTVPLAADAQTKTVDPPGTSGIMAQYRSWFAAADANKDGMLDKEELAKAFRGPFAKPFDYVPPPKTAKDKDEKDKSEKDKSEKDKSEKDKSASAEKPARKPDYSRYPDYNFLVQLDVNSDEMVSREEFDNWARDLAVQIKNQLEAQLRLQQLQAQLMAPGKLKPSEKKKLEAELKKERDQITRLQEKMHKLEKHIKQAKKPVPHR